MYTWQQSPCPGPRAAYSRWGWHSEPSSSKHRFNSTRLFKILLLCNVYMVQKHVVLGNKIWNAQSTKGGISNQSHHTEKFLKNQFQLNPVIWFAALCRPINFNMAHFKVTIEVGKGSEANSKQFWGLVQPTRVGVRFTFHCGQLLTLKEIQNYSMNRWLCSVKWADSIWQLWYGKTEERGGAQYQI